MLTRVWKGVKVQGWMYFMAICVNYWHSEKKPRSRYYRRIRANEIEERIPLKQGLKLPNPHAIKSKVFTIEERIPLKQGLKPKAAKNLDAAHAKD